MTEKTEDIPRDNLTLEGCVRNFLELALIHPEKPPKTQRAQRDNQFMIIGYNQAQEVLRTILEQHGAAVDIKKLAQVRSELQMVPETLGGKNFWVVG